jgi:SsrA-binding protein
MNRKKPKPKQLSGDGQTRNIAENRKARFRFEILEQIECGIALVGSEVKSLRDGKLSLEEAYARIRNGELWLVGADIAEYRQANRWNHEPKRPRKLLVHARQFKALAARANEKGLTLVPLKMYFNSRGIVKILVGVCRGKKLYDKRETQKSRDAKRQIDRALKSRKS